MAAARTRTKTQTFNEAPANHGGKGSGPAAKWALRSDPSMRPPRITGEKDDDLR